MLHFAVLGDVHHVRPESHSETLAGRPRGVTEYADVTRNLEFTRTCVPNILAEISATQPQFIMQLGDVVQGHCDDPSGTDIEMQEAVAKMQATGIPCTFAVASHDGGPGTMGGHAVDLYMRPCIETFLGHSIATNYYSFVLENTLFIVLDYMTFKVGDTQEQWLHDTLAACSDVLQANCCIKHILLFCHVPAVPVGRPFFSPLHYVQAIQSCLAQYPIEAYFCGHTHNQVASLHRFGDRWSAHLKSSILGYADRSVLLEDVRELLPPRDSESFEYGWGYLEDSMPGWWDVHIDGDTVKVKWMVYTKGIQGELSWETGVKPSFLRQPQAPTSQTSLPSLDEIAAVRLRVAGMGARLPVYEVTLNGQVIGTIPSMEYFDVRQFLSIAPEFWPILRSINDINIGTADEPICVGGFVLEVQTKSGATARSTISHGLITNSSRWDGWGEPSLTKIAPGQPISMQLCFSE